MDWFWEYGIWLTGFAASLFIGLLFMFWGLWGDRSKCRARCPKCWYDMRGNAEAKRLKCPECGHDARIERRLFRNRKRHWAIILGFLLWFPPCYAGWIYYGWWREQGAIAAINTAHSTAEQSSLDDLFDGGSTRSGRFFNSPVQVQYTGPQWRWFATTIPRHILKYYDRATNLDLNRDIGAIRVRIPELRRLKTVRLRSAGAFGAVPRQAVMWPGSYVNGYWIPNNTWQREYLPIVTALPRLERLTINNALLHNDDIDVIANATNLQNVEITHERYNISPGPGMRTVLSPRSPAIRFDGRGFGRWTGMARLESVSIRGGGGSNGILAHLSSLPNLRSLAVTQCDISDDGVHHLANLQNIETLRLDDTQISNQALPAVGQLTSLKELYLNDVNITDAGLAHLAQLTNLTHLWLNDVNIVDEGLSHLFGLTNIERLAIPHADVSGDSLNHLSQMKELREISLGDGHIDDSSASYFHQWPKLERMYFGHAPELTDASIDHFIAIPTLNYLNIRETGISEQGKAKLRKAFPGAEIR